MATAIARKRIDGTPAHAGEPPANRVFNTGSANVYINGAQAVRVTDTTLCGDEAVEGSGTVFVNGLAVHRIGDDILDHTGTTRQCESNVNGGDAGTVIAG